MTDVEKIEYYLGKDKFKDKFFKGEFPFAYQDIASKDTITEDKVSQRLFLNPWYPDISFDINNKGFRSHFDFNLEELKGKKIILCLGCTDTFGMNVYYEQAWPTILGDRLKDYTVLNCGIIGASADTVSRMFIKISQVLADEVKFVCLLWPHNNRREFVSKEFTKVLTTFDINTTPYDEYWDFIDWKSDNYNYFKNKHLVENIAKANDIKLFDLIINRFDKKVPYDYAGKFFALGKNSHLAISNYFYKKIFGEPSLYEEKNGKQD